MGLPIVLNKRRPDTVTTFVLTVGIVDAVMGGVSGHVPLLILGLVLMGGAIALYLPKSLKPRRKSPPPSRQRLLPERSSLSNLPDTVNRS